MLSRRAFVSIAAIAPATAQNSNRRSAQSIEDFFEKVTAEWMRRNPSLATSARYFSGAEQDALERQLTPATPAFRRQSVAFARQALADLRKFDRAALTHSLKDSADVLEWQLQSLIESDRNEDYSFPLQQMSGVNVTLIESLTVRHPLATARDAENYIAALGQVRERMEEAIARARELQAKNILPPKFILEATVRQLQNFTDPSPAQNTFVTSLSERLPAIRDMSEEKKQQLHAAAEKITTEQIYPVWKKAEAFLQSQLPRATNDAGLWRFRDGAEVYSRALYQYTSLRLKPAEIHQIGLKRVAEIESQMDMLLRRIGRTQGTVKERIDKLRLDLQYPDPASEASRNQIMLDIDAMIEGALRSSASAFDIQPKAKVVARPFPTFRENNAAANYNAPSADGSRPGTFQFPRRLNNMTKFALRSLVYHETVPGHHFHIALQVENKDLPRFMRIRAFGGVAATSEGWGLYAERFAAEAGWYEDDIEGLLGQLDSELFRARRLVVDTGLHAMKWTRQQAIDYGIPVSEVERYVVMPGQACAYMLGQLKIIELREKAKQQLGPRFSLRDFHTTVLKAGVIPLELLERKVDAWIASNKA
jgi:uncharacterized protein (DUF885 family)